MISKKSHQESSLYLIVLVKTIHDDTNQDTNKTYLEQPMLLVISKYSAMDTVQSTPFDPSCTPP